MKNFIIEFPQIQLDCELKQNCIKTQPKIVHNEIQLGVNIQGLFQQISGLHEFDQSLSSNIAANYWDKYQTAYAIENASHIKIEIVQVLPPIAQAEEYTLYLLAKINPQIGDYYEEYMKINNAWQKIGQTTVDLSNYYNKTQTDALLSAKADLINLNNYLPLSGSTYNDQNSYLSGELVFKQDFDKTITPSANINNMIYFLDKNSANLARINITRSATNNELGCVLNVYDTNSNNSTYFTVKYLNGGKYITSDAQLYNIIANTQTKSDSSTKIATTQYVKNNLNDYLPLSGGTLSGDIIIKTDYDKTTLSTFFGTGFYIKDKNNKRICSFHNEMPASRNNTYAMVVNNPNSTSDSDFANIYLKYNNNGTKIINSNATFTNCLANTQTKSDSSTKIATTEFVKNNLSDYLPLASGGTISGALSIDTRTSASKLSILTNYDKISLSGLQSQNICFKDVNNRFLTRIIHVLNADHNNSCSFWVNNPNATSDSDYTYLTVQYTNSGDKRILTDATFTQGKATTQSTSTNNTTLANCEFVHNVVNAQIGNINSILDAINGEIL